MCASLFIFAVVTLKQFVCWTRDKPESDPSSVRTTHIPLDEVPGLLRGRVVAGVVVQHFGDDLGHLSI